jgi:hypothetical protein
VGFFEAGGFWPDFILWHIDAEGAQTIVFTDPHGLRVSESAHSGKIRFSESVKNIETRVNQNAAVPVRLESAILSPSNAAQIRSLWHMTDAEFATLHVFFMQDAPGYLYMLCAVARTGRPDSVTQAHGFR